MSDFLKNSYWKQENYTCTRNNTSHLEELNKSRAQRVGD